MPGRTIVAIFVSAVTVSGGTLAACSEPSTYFGPPEQQGQTNREVPEAGPPAPSTCGDAGVPECGVSFASDLYPKLTGTWGCSHAGCHSGAVAPTIEPGDASATYAALSAYPSAPPRFIEPCGSDAAASTFVCTVTPPTCGSLMPLGTYGAQPLDDADIASINAWIGCGSPNN